MGYRAFWARAQRSAAEGRERVRRGPVSTALAAGFVLGLLAGGVVLGGIGGWWGVVLSVALVAVMVAVGYGARPVLIQETSSSPAVPGKPENSRAGG